MILDDRPVIDRLSEEYRTGDPLASLWMLEERVQELTGGTPVMFAEVAEQLRELATTRDYSASGYSRIPLRWDHLSEDEQERVFTGVIDGVCGAMKLLDEYAQADVERDIERAFSDYDALLQTWQQARR